MPDVAMGEAQVTKEFEICDPRLGLHVDPWREVPVSDQPASPSHQLV